MINTDLNDIVSTEIWVDHPDGRIFVQRWTPDEQTQGDGSHPPRPAPIVLFHDSLGCVSLWRDFPARLSAATGREVLAYDRLGFGRSGPRKGIPGIGFIADEAVTVFPLLREQLGLRRFVAFGHSVGGGMAIHCAARFPDDCEALVTEAAQTFLEDRTIQGITLAKEQFKDPQQIGRLRKYHGEKAQWVVDAWTETWLNPAFADWTLAGVLPGVRCPVLAIHGIFDEYGSTRHPEMIASLAGGPARAAVMDQTHHVPHRERGDEVLAMVSGFLESGSASG
ncbi:alpha/beta fold hydrolase [Noviherbaspirillum galbum]|uniref:Alpha/beta hydrolase n=1 Tax=Noviherbaspirillum galbum TaxID=2709383 RepID=A0A6B3SM98_9BURK|nr:alpha/beta hydrolase [Noviherbaspirillum galbum]NEX59492.1 alpha/beta hydrolase [Noviherbaspirillum galbum]